MLIQSVTGYVPVFLFTVFSDRVSSSCPGWLGAQLGTELGISIPQFPD